MTLHCVKLGRVVTLMKYLPSAVSLIFLVKGLIWNKITFPAPNLLNVTEVVENESIHKKIYQYSYFYSFYHCLI